MYFFSSKFLSCLVLEKSSLKARDTYKVTDSLKRSQELCVYCVWFEVTGMILRGADSRYLSALGWNTGPGTNTVWWIQTIFKWRRAIEILGTHISQSSWLSEMFVHIFNAEFQMYMQFAPFSSQAEKYVLIEKNLMFFLYGCICSRVGLVFLLIIPNSEGLVSLIP